MKKLLLTAAASMALVSVASAANATSLTDWTLLKIKRTHISATTVIVTTVGISVTDQRALDSAAKSIAVVNSDIVANDVGRANASFTLPGGPTINIQGDTTDYNIYLSADITSSVHHDLGIGQVNQDAGNNSNQ